jgi:hypothetical protein
MIGMGELGFVFLIVLIVIIVLCSIGFWIWMIVDCANNEPPDGTTLLMWIIIIVSLHWVGALIYYLARRPHRIATYGK